MPVRLDGEPKVVDFRLQPGNVEGGLRTQAHKFCTVVVRDPPGGQCAATVEAEARRRLLARKGGLGSAAAAAELPAVAPLGDARAVRRGPPPGAVSRRSPPGASALHMPPAPVHDAG